MTKPKKFTKPLLIALIILGVAAVALGIAALYLGDEAPFGDGTYRDGFSLGVLNAALTFIACDLLVWSIQERIRISRAEKSGMEPRPVDPDRPPTYATVVRADGDPETRCTCHEQPVEDGATVLHWPQPAQVLCEQTYTQEPKRP
ncbi:hypothetical protein ABZS76_33410 [Streptomyces sp. NPDC005562]|uniref:hypothetical protein n=1 Tax=Streptomyces sp. NPDC005562 TaxID=3154890 RepID=UPI0033A71CFB